MTSVPFPGVDWIVMVPSTVSSRSTMPWSPVPMVVARGVEAGTIVRDLERQRALVL